MYNKQVLKYSCMIQSQMDATNSELPNQIIWPGKINNSWAVEILVLKLLYSIFVQ